MSRLFKESLAAVILLAASAGCSMTEDMIEPGFDTSEKTVVFIPFRERNVYYFESMDGMQISGLLSQLVSVKSTELKVVDDIAPCVPLIRGKDPDSIDWKEVGKAAKADYVVIGAIKTISARDPALHVNCYKGTFNAEIEVIQVSTGRVVMHEEVFAKYPTGNFQPEYLSVLEATEDEILSKVKERGVKMMAEFFYPHSPDED